VIGDVYNMPPQPPVPENTRYLPAGAVTFGVEYRDVDPASLAATYESNAAHLAELDRRSPVGGFSDEGVSIHVCGTADSHEYLRFDVFDDEPHYHYIHPPTPGGELVNHVVGYDAVALGDMLPWALERLRTRLPAMLTEAGGADLAGQVDHEAVGRAVAEIEALAERVRRAARAPSSG
jgi:hypothetical protein